MKSSRKNVFFFASISVALTAPSAFAEALTWDITSGDNATITARTGAGNTTGDTLEINGFTDLVGGFPSPTPPPCSAHSAPCFYCATRA